MLVLATCSESSKGSRVKLSDVFKEVIHTLEYKGAVLEDI